MDDYTASPAEIAQSQTRAIVSALLALGRPASAAELSDATDLPADVVTRRLCQNGPQQMRGELRFFRRTAGTGVRDGLWEPTARGREYAQGRNEMGKYFNPPDPKRFGQTTADDLTAAGGRVLAEGNFAMLRSQLRDGEELAFYGDRLAFKVVAALPDEGEYREFEDQYRSGSFVRRSFWALPRAVFDRKGAA